MGARGFLLLVCVGVRLFAGSVTGRVELRDSKDSAVRKKMDYSGVVVWLEPLDGAPALSSTVRAKMLQKDKTFTPHVLPVSTGTTVDFPNFDPIFHNAFSNFDGKVFDVGLYAPGTNRSVHFDRPGVVRVFCNIHAAMSAVILVLDTPYFAATKKDGSLDLGNVPAGNYKLRIFHERATGAALLGAERRLTITADALQLPLISLSESGYVEAPHKNKFGHDYGPDPDDHGVYPAARK